MIIDTLCRNARGTKCCARTVKKDAQGNQVKAVFMKTADNVSQCDLKKLYCSPGYTEPDAYTANQLLKWI